MKRVVVNLDTELHQQFKAMCYKNGRTCREVLEEFVKNYVKANQGG